VDGSRFSVQKGVDQFRRKFLNGSFTTSGSRREVQAYYAELLSSNGYPIRMQSIASAPPGRKGWVEGERYSNGNPGPRVAIRIDLIPDNELLRVEVRMTAYP